MSNAPSNPGDFTPEESVMTLPRRNAAGEELKVRIRALPFAKVEEFWKGMPGATNVVSAKLAVKEEDAAREERMRAIIREGLVSPKILFDGDADDGGPAVPAAQIHPQNIAAICMGIMLHSGVGTSQEAAAVLGFRYVERGGVALGGGTDGSVPAGEVAAQPAG